MAHASPTLIQNLGSESIAVLRRELGGLPDAWHIDEIGDGNVNLIFRVWGPIGQVLVKQAVP